MNCDSTKRSSYRIAVRLLAVAALLLPGVLHARQLDVGPGRKFATPSAAAAAARPGDTIVIQVGEYFDCAVWDTDRITIAGAAPGVTITDKTCEGKALFVIRGNDITVRNVTFTRARVPDGNGAGIRAEGRNLTVENSRFVNNESGILAGDDPASTITISNSEFRENGKCAAACAHGIYVGRIGLLRVTASTFDKTKVGHSIKSRALRTELRDNIIVDGAEGTSSYLIDIPNGGSLIMEGNTLEKGPKSSNPGAAVVIGAEGVAQPTRELRIAANRFSNNQSGATVFVRNLTATPAVLTGNTLAGKVKPLSGDGSVN